MVRAFLGCSMAFSGLTGLLHEASLESLRARVWGSFKGSVLSGPVGLQSSREVLGTLWELGVWFLAWCAGCSSFAV